MAIFASCSLCGLDNLAPPLQRGPAWSTHHQFLESHYLPLPLLLLSGNNTTYKSVILAERQN